uniref:F-box domain-containing protein n=1 Tax=Megaselia scalaris TaxID=36166 RepID=T1GCP3_MEGSC
MDTLLNYYPVITTLCGKLSYRELKSLSCASKGWWEATNSLIVNKTLLKIDKPCCVKFQRKYKYVKIDKIDFEMVLPTLPDSIAIFNFKQIQIKDFQIFKRFKKLKGLWFYLCDFPAEIPNKEALIFGLESLHIMLSNTNEIALVDNFIKANNKIEDLQIQVSIYDDESSAEIMVNTVLANIHLPYLKEIYIRGWDNSDFNCGLIGIFKNISSIKSCKLKYLKLSDTIFENIHNTCKKLETLSIVKCENLTGHFLKDIKKVPTLKHLELFKSEINVEELQKIYIPQLTSFRVSLSEDSPVSGMNSIQTQSMIKHMINLTVLDLTIYKACIKRQFWTIQF